LIYFGFFYCPKLSNQNLSAVNLDEIGDGLGMGGYQTNFQNEPSPIASKKKTIHPGLAKGWRVIA
jgi:hypothetical protein